MVLFHQKRQQRLTLFCNGGHAAVDWPVEFVFYGIGALTSSFKSRSNIEIIEIQCFRNGGGQ